MTPTGAQRRAELKRKLRARSPVFAAWTSLYHPSITEIFAEAGVDFVGIDIEHSTIDLEQSLILIAACQGKGILCLPRVASHNMEMIKRLLDAGADGLIVPMVSTSSEVEQLIEWSNYPPEGRRSFGNARGQEYGFNFAEYVEQWNDLGCLIIQIETMEGVKNIDELLAYEAVDGAMVGPYDLSGALGIPGKLDDPRVVEASKHVMAECEAHGKACGTHIIEPDETSVADALGLGYTFVVLASDIFILWKWSERMKTIIDRLKD